MEPKVMGRTLDIHPLVVLVVTALGGLLGGIVGLILAVPAWVIASNAISRARSRGVFEQVADARPARRATPARLTTPARANHVICRDDHHIVHCLTAFVSTTRLPVLTSLRGYKRRGSRAT